MCVAFYPFASAVVVLFYLIRLFVIIHRNIKFSIHLCAVRTCQQSLGIKTYQSDLFNNWLSTEWIDGTNGINAITAIDTSTGSFNIDTLNLSKKVYDMLNRIAVSGGSYDDWLDAVYTHERYQKAETPMYMGGLIKEVIFQEVINNSETQGDGNTQVVAIVTGKQIGRAHV